MPGELSLYETDHYPQPAKVGLARVRVAKLQETLDDALEQAKALVEIFAYAANVPSNEPVAIDDVRRVTDLLWQTHRALHTAEYSRTTDEQLVGRIRILKAKTGG